MAARGSTRTRWGPGAPARSVAPHLRGSSPGGSGGVRPEGSLRRLREAAMATARVPDRRERSEAAREVAARRATGGEEAALALPARPPPPSAGHAPARGPGARWRRPGGAGAQAAPRAARLGQGPAGGGAGAGAGRCSCHSRRPRPCWANGGRGRAPGCANRGRGGGQAGTTVQSLRLHQLGSVRSGRAGGGWTA